MNCCTFGTCKETSDQQSDIDAEQKHISKVMKEVEDYQKNKSDTIVESIDEPGRIFNELLTFLKW